MVSNFTLTVNGGQHVVSASADTPLLYVLRNELHLRGPRLGCGLGQCGACAVLADGKATRACVTPVSQVVGRQIVTLEGLASVWANEKGRNPADAANSLHPIQQAWIDERVPQCGYCQNGMMIAAADLLRRIPKPSVAQIKDAYSNAPPSPYLCRCGTYSAIINAVQRAANTMVT